MKMNSRPQARRPARTADEDEIRDYAYHLYEQAGRVPGHDLDHWLEARACLEAGIPLHQSRTRLHRMVKGLGPAEQVELCTQSAEVRHLLS